MYVCSGCNGVVVVAYTHACVFQCYSLALNHICICFVLLRPFSQVSLKSNLCQGAFDKLKVEIGREQPLETKKFYYFSVDPC